MLLLALNGCSAFSGRGPAESAGLVGKAIAIPNYCDSFQCTMSVEFTNSGSSPYDLRGDLCTVIDGKTYTDQYVSETINPGQTTQIISTFNNYTAELKAGAVISEVYVGDCGNESSATIRISTNSVVPQHKG